MTTAAIFLPLVLASLFMIAAVRQELAQPLLSPRLAPAVKKRTGARKLRVETCDPGAIAALNVSDFERR
ncbi:hypothetical protein M2323_000988 [Rhodoblastus acidophilus]|uniref:hypothetical protein n=1 Tax=Rhodoblastus acidophilus TaxID=1074 RepID=UPI002225178F|nr:hypothetical protein [Rhodoblastus acidophilus]MCW2283219.1 hypothetical protein [Rhodoblastus acidophilus]MCW2332079.1 hypothetical protein [Rhodoblastus acidophilus]